MNNLEAVRREPPTSSLGGVPITLPARTLDYASAGVKIDLAVHHLDEALCSRQKLRAERAMALLKVGVQELEEWMKLSGYAV